MFPYNVKTTKKDLIRRMKERENPVQNLENPSNLSPSTLQHMAENKRKVDAGLLPRYVDGTVDTPSNPEVERKAARVLDFSRILSNRKSRNEY
jgi:hypothetical protein